MTSERIVPAGHGLYIRVFFAWFDCWVGIYVDQKAPRIFIGVIPMLMIEIGRRV